MGGGKIFTKKQADYRNNADAWRNSVCRSWSFWLEMDFLDQSPHDSTWHSRDSLLSPYQASTGQYFQESTTVRLAGVRAVCCIDRFLSGSCILGYVLKFLV